MNFKHQVARKKEKVNSYNLFLQLLFVKNDNSDITFFIHLTKNLLFIFPNFLPPWIKMRFHSIYNYYRLQFRGELERGVHEGGGGEGIQRLV